jgi:hypothetical protein
MRSIVISAIAISLIGFTPQNRVRSTDLHAATISRGFGERSVQRLQKDPKRVMERGGGIYFSW